MHPPVKHRYQFGPFRLDPAERLLYRDGEVVPLTAKVFDILLVFVEHSGRTLEKEEVMEQVWPGQFVEEGNLTRNVSTLRKLLGESPDDHRYIVTIPGRGYRFVAEVREMMDEEARPGMQSNVTVGGVDEAMGAAAAALARTAGSDEEAGAAAGQVKRRTGVVWWVSLAVFGLALAFALYALMRERRSTPPSPITSIVVLPLQNLSGDAAQEYFADGMTDALIGELAKIGALRVISRTSAMHFKGTKQKLPEIAGELKVEAVVEGTVLRSGDRLRVRVQLIRAATDQHLWAETYEHDLRDVLALQSGIARAIAREIEIKLTPDEQARLANTRPVNRKAYDDYLLGIYHWNKRTEEHLRRALDYFQSALREDASYAPAYAGLADCYLVLAFFYRDPREFFPKAKAEAIKALEIDGTLAEAHTTLASVIAPYDWDWQGAEREFKRAIELNAGYPTAHQRYSLLLMEMGRTEESLTEIKRALDWDPVSLIINTSYGWRLYLARRYDQALEQLRKTLEMDPNFFLARIYLGRVYAQTGRYAESLAELNKAVELSRGDALAELGYTYAMSGRRSEAQQVLAEVRELSRRRYIPSADVAVIYAGLGEKEQAFAWLEKAYEERSSRLTDLKTDPRFDSLRSDPRGEALLRRIGLAP